MPMKDRPSSALKLPPEGTLYCCSPGDPSLGHAPTEGITTGVIDVSGTFAKYPTYEFAGSTYKQREAQRTDQSIKTHKQREAQRTDQSVKIHKQCEAQRTDQSIKVPVCRFKVRTGSYSENGSELLIT